MVVNRLGDTDVEVVVVVVVVAVVGVAAVTAAAGGGIEHEVVVDKVVQAGADTVGPVEVVEAAQIRISRAGEMPELRLAAYADYIGQIRHELLGEGAGAAVLLFRLLGRIQLGGSRLL